MEIKLGIDHKYVPQAIEMFLDSFGEQFFPIFGNDQRIRSLFQKSINTEYVMAMIKDQQLIAFLGYQTQDKNVFTPQYKDIINIYGFWKGNFISLIMLIFSSRLNNNEIYLKLFFVSVDWQKQGIGSNLFYAFEKYCSQNHYHKIYLRILDTNLIAKNFYEKLGFVKIGVNNVRLYKSLIGWKFKEMIIYQKKYR